MTYTYAKVKAMGTYAGPDKMEHAYHNVVMFVPYNKASDRQDITQLNVISRTLPDTLFRMSMEDNSKMKPFQRLRARYMEIEIVELDEPYSFLDKKIKDMNEAELQDMASYFDFRKVPLARKANVFKMRLEAYKAYDAFKKLNSVSDPKTFGVEDMDDLTVEIDFENEEEIAESTPLSPNFLMVLNTRLIENDIKMKELKEACDKLGIKYTSKTRRDTLVDKAKVKVAELMNADGI